MLIICDSGGRPDYYADPRDETSWAELCQFQVRLEVIVEVGVVF